MTILVTNVAPDFTAPAVLSDGKIVNDFNYYSQITNHMSILFFYPLDFTFVCPTELIALDHRIEEFNRRGIILIAISIDSQFSHSAWRKIDYSQGGVGLLPFPMVADKSHEICRLYGIEHPTEKVALRAAFIVDKNKIVRSQIVNDLPIGRNINELLRLADAVQHNDEFGEVCPAGWQAGEPSIKPHPDGVVQYLDKHIKKL